MIAGLAPNDSKPIASESVFHRGWKANRWRKNGHFTLADGNLIEFGLPAAPTILTQWLWSDDC